MADSLGLTGPGLWDKIGGGFEWLTGTGKYDPTKKDRAGLNQQIQLGNRAGDWAGDYATRLQDEFGQDNKQLQGTYGSLGDAMNYQRGLMTGQNSVSAEQLRQSLGQSLAAQQSMAAGAAPQNAAMAARTAARNQAMLGSGLAGQQALAGLQERNQAAAMYGNLGQALGQLQLGARGQDITGSNQARGNQISAYGNGANAYGTAIGHPQQTTGQNLLNAGIGLASVLTKPGNNGK